MQKGPRVLIDQALTLIAFLATKVTSFFSVCIILIRKIFEKKKLFNKIPCAWLNYFSNWIIVLKIYIIKKEERWDLHAQSKETVINLTESRQRKNYLHTEHFWRNSWSGNEIYGGEIGDEMKEQLNLNVETHLCWAEIPTGYSLYMAGNLSRTDTVSMMQYLRPISKTSLVFSKLANDINRRKRQVRRSKTGRYNRPVHINEVLMNFTVSRNGKDEFPQTWKILLYRS